MTRAAKSFSPQQLFILAGLSIVSVLGLISLVRWVSQPTYSVLVSGASMSETAKVTAALDGSGISYKLSSTGSGVSVAQADLAKANMALNTAGVTTDGSRPGYDVLDGQGLTVSDFKQQVDYKRAIEGELANTLTQMDGVDTARINLSLPEKALFKDDQSDPRASVLIGANAALDSTAVRAIMQTVASAVPGLTTDNVTVTDTTGQILSVAGMGAGADPMQMAHKFEAATGAQAQTMLDAMLGAGHSVVRVNADMDFNETESKQTAYDKENAVVVASQRASETFQGASATIPMGIAGVTGTTLAPTTGADQKYEKSDDANSVAVGSTETLTRIGPGRLQKLSVAVALDQATLDKLGIDEQGLTNIRQLVIAATGAQVNDASPDQSRDVVAVRAQMFDTEDTKAVNEALEAAESAESKDAMIRYAKTGAALLVLVLVALFLRKGLRSRGDEVEEIDGAALARSAESFGALRSGELRRPSPAGAIRPAAAAGEDARLASRRALDPATEVLDLIDREPEDVAALLRSWVADRRS